MKVDRRLFLAGASTLALVNCADARFPRGASGVHGWNNAKAGAGGLITGLDVAPDGTVVCRTDVFGAYVYDRTAVNPGNAGGLGCWKQLVTTTSMAGYLSLIQTPFMAADGVYEIRIAPSNSNILYMVYLGYVWYSTNKGVTWTQTAFTRDTSMFGNTGGSRFYDFKMAVDTLDPNVVYLSTFSSGLKRTTGGTSGGAWSSIGTVPANDASGIGCVAVDGSSSTTSGRKSVVYISVSGSGLYKSTDGGGTFSAVSGGPGATAIIKELQIAVDGTVFVIDYNTAKLWRLVGSTWTDITPSGLGDLNAVSVHPTNKDSLIAWSYGLGPRETTTATTGTAGSMWAAQNASSNMVAADTPLIGTLRKNFFTSGILTPRWDPTDLTKIWMAANQGVWRATHPLAVSPTPIDINCTSAGIEEIVAQDIVVPPGYAPLFFGHDVGVFQQTDLTKYALAQAWNTASFLSFGSGGDYASSDPSFVCGVVDNQGSTEVTGYSLSAGAVGTWVAFASAPSGVDGTYIGGCIAAATDQKMIWVPANGGRPNYTSNRGTSWSTIAGLPDEDSWSHNYIYKRHTVAADRVNLGTFYVQSAANGFGTFPGTYKVTNGVLDNYYANTIDLGANSRMRSVPGNAGHLFFTSGPSGSGGNPASDWPHAQLFYYSTNGGSTWADVGALSSNNFTIREVWDFGFGKAKPGGGGYPVIYLYGFIIAGSSPSPAGSVPEFWKSEDQGVTWVKFGDQFPMGWPDWCTSVNGDMNIYGRVYVGFQGSGWIYYTL